MKEWAPASTMPELASAAFAAGDAPKSAAPAKPVAEEESFDGRSTIKGEQRRTTLLGVPPPADEPPDSHPLDVPAVGPLPERPGVTQVPPFGAPLPEKTPAPAAVAGGLRLRSPGAPAQPVVASTPADAPQAKPRKPLTSDIDGMWSGPPSEEDETLPRRPRASQLAAAAAASAEAAAHLGLGGRPRPVNPKPPVAATLASPVTGGAKRPSKPPPLPRRPVAGSGARLDTSAVPVNAKPAAQVPAAGLRPQPRPPVRTTTTIGLSPLAKGPPPLPPSRLVPAPNGAAPAPVPVRITPPPMPVLVRPSPEPIAPIAVAVAPEPSKDERPEVPLHLTTFTEMKSPVAPEKPPLPAIPPDLPGSAKRQITATLVSPTASSGQPAAALPPLLPEATAGAAPVDPEPAPQLPPLPVRVPIPTSTGLGPPPLPSFEEAPAPVAEVAAEHAAADAPPLSFTEPFPRTAVGTPPPAPVETSPGEAASALPSAALPEPGAPAVAAFPGVVHGGAANGPYGAMPAPRMPAPSRSSGRAPELSRPPIREAPSFHGEPANGRAPLESFSGGSTLRAASEPSRPSFSGIASNPTPQPPDVSVTAGGTPAPALTAGGTPAPPGDVKARQGPVTMRPRARPGLPSTPRVPALGDGRGRLDEPVPVPVSSLLGAGGLLIGMVVAAFFVGRASRAGRRGSPPSLRFDGDPGAARGPRSRRRPSPAGW